MIDWAVVAVAGTIFKGYGKIYEGYATKAYYDAQAMTAEFKGKDQVIDSKEQGNLALKNMNATLAAAIARAGAGGTGFEGSFTTLTTQITRGGVEELKLTKLNEQYITGLTIFEAQQLRQAGNIAKRMGYVKAFTDMAIQGATMQKQGVI